MLRDKNHNEISKYLSGKMTQEEAHAFEKSALEDPFLQDAIDGAEQLRTETFIHDVKNLDSKIKTNHSKQVFTIWRVAAVISLLIVGGYSVQYLLTDIQPKQMVQEMEKDDSLKNGDTTKNELDEAKVELEPPKDVAETKEEILKEEPTASAPIARRGPDVSNRSSGAGLADRAEEFFEEEESPSAEDTRDMEVLDEVGDFNIAAESSSREEFDAAAGFVAEAASAPVEMKEEDESRKAKKANKNISNQKAFLKTRNDELAARSRASSETPNQIEGTITDEAGEGLPGVVVVIKGTTIGVTSDLDGAFQITANGEDELVFSSVGMVTQEVKIGSRSILEVEMSLTTQSLQEVVVTGYAANDNKSEGYTEPSPVSDWKLYSDYLDENLRYPEVASEKGTEGRVVLQLTVSRIGTITNIEVKRSLGDDCDEEAIRLIEDGPTWKPASRDGISVEGNVKIRVKFKLD
ncbi:MAG: TonB family protein [Cytophagales bacterium]|nr:TonB family protein [Cytophagales bacterium]